MAFVKGQSGNPSGRKKVNGVVSELAKAESPDAFRRIVHLAKDNEFRAKEPKAWLQANQYIVDRDCGKPAQAVEHTGEDGGPVIVRVLAYGQITE